METSLLSKLKAVNTGLYYIAPELILVCGILIVLLAGLITRNKKNNLQAALALLVFLISLSVTVFYWNEFDTRFTLFGTMIRTDHYSGYFKILIDLGALLTVLMAWRNKDLSAGKFNTEFYALLIAATLGAHLLTMSTNLIMIFISLELLSIGSYVLAGYSLTKKGAEGSLKYFLFGSVASAIMLYGFSILFGVTGTTEFTAPQFTARLIENHSSLVIIASMMSLAGFFYKIAIAPMHIWSPDVYEASPMPVVAFLSVIPKLAGLVILSKFIVSIAALGNSSFDWQLILGVIAMITIAIGNFSALRQKNPKRMIAYSSIAQSGFLLIGVVCFTDQSLHALAFYSALYLAANFAVIIALQAFEKHGIESITDFRGIGKSFLLISILLLIGLISLSGIPPTGGFTSKLFVFVSLWSSYEQTGKGVLLWLLIFGLLNTVISLFYYLKIPYYAFLKTPSLQPQPQNTRLENFLAFILVVVVVFLFIRPDLLMGWLNTINFVL